MIKLMKALCVGVGLALATVVSAAVCVQFGITLYFSCAAVVAVVAGGLGFIGAPRRTSMALAMSLVIGTGWGLIWPPAVSAALLLVGLSDVIRLRVTPKAASNPGSLTTLEARLIAMDGDQMVELIDDFVEAPDVVRERLQGLGWSETEVIYFGALIKTAAQHRLIDGNAWRGQIKAA